MKKRRKPARRTALQFESLESRFALAGLVTVTPGTKGALTIAGDSAANDITITLVNNQWHIVANGDTQVRLGGKVPGPAGASLDVAVPTGKVDILTGFADPDSDATDKKHASGNETADVVKFDGSVNPITVAGALTITGKNAGVVEIDGTTVSGKTTITFGNGLSDTDNGVGTSVIISDSEFGPIPSGKTKGSDFKITTGSSKGVTRDIVSITQSDVGGKLSILTQGAKTAGGALATDQVAIANSNVLGDLSVKGINGGEVQFDQIEVKGATAITFGNGISTGEIGTNVRISDSKLGLVSPKGKNTTITTALSNDHVLVTDTKFGGAVTINTKDGNNNVAMLGTRSDPFFEQFESSTSVGGNLAISTGSGRDRVGVLGLLVNGKLSVATGKGNDFSGAADMAVLGTTSVTSLDGDDVAAIGLRDAAGNPLPANGFGNVLVGNVTVNMGNGNDTVAAHKTTFGRIVNGKPVGGKITVSLGAGDDSLAESENNFLPLGSDEFESAIFAIKGSRGGSDNFKTTGVGDTIVSSLAPLFDFQMKFLQFENQDLNRLDGILETIFTDVNDGFHDILLDYGIDIGGGGGGGDDHGNTISQASDLGTLPTFIAGTIGQATDVDLFSFTVAAGETVEFTLTPDSNFDPALRLFDQDGTPIQTVDSGFDGDVEHVFHTFEQAGTYFAGVTGWANVNYDAVSGAGASNGFSTGGYSLEVGSIPADNDDAIDEVLTELQVDALDPTAGEISNGFDVDLYTVNLGANQNVTIHLQPDFDSDPFPNIQLVLRVFGVQTKELIDNGIDPPFYADIEPVLVNFYTVNAFSGGLAVDDLVFNVANEIADFQLFSGTFFIGVSSFGNNAYSAENGSGDIEGDFTGFYSLSVTTTV